MTDAAVADRPSNVVRVGFSKPKFVYVDVTKHLLHEGEQTVHISALAAAIPEAVSIVELLKAQDMVVVTKIATSRESTDLFKVVDKIVISVKKSPHFEEKYAEQQKMREEKRAAKEAGAEDE